jgi:sulfite reductase alpha subunit-like flavoprotein
MVLACVFGDRGPAAESVLGTCVPLVRNEELLKVVEVSSRSTRRLAFSIAGTKLKYETGDHLGVVRMCPCIHKHKRAHTRPHTHTHTLNSLTHSHARSHTHTHTHTHTQPWFDHHTHSPGSTMLIKRIFRAL